MRFNKKGPKRNRIPVHFVDEESLNPTTEQDEEDPPSSTPDVASNAEGEAGDSEPSEQAHEDLDGDTAVRADDGGLTVEGSSDQSATADNEDSLASTSEASPHAVSEPGTSRPALDAAATGPLLAELIATRAELRRVETEQNELREALARRQADFENYRKRVERERTESYNRMVGDVVSKLLPVLDNLRRAVEAEGSLQANESEEFRHFLHGVELIYKQLRGVLEGLGLQPIAALGHRFDPHVHEAVVTEQTEEFEPDTVIQEIVPGYRLGEKLLRPAIVKVATR